jgi:actin-related protein 9
MFPAERKGEFEPYKVRERRCEVHTINGAKQDIDMRDATDKGEGKVTVQSIPKLNAADGVSIINKEQVSKPLLPEEVVYEEDIVSVEGAIYPMQNGRIADWQCFFSLLTHIYNTLSPPFHTPIMLISEPVWSARDREMLTQFIFEKFKTPAFCLMDSALAACYAYGTPTATVVDIGHGKADVTAVTDFVVQDHGRGIAVEGCGGKAMTNRLFEFLNQKGFTREMCEQLKRSNITEILPSGTPLPGVVSPPKGPNATLLSSAGSLNGRPPNTSISRGAGGNAQTGAEGNGDVEEDDGVLNVAAIVSGNTSEFLAKREKEKAERTVSKKSGGDPTNKAVRLPNAKKDKASFQFEEFVRIEPQNGAFTTAGQYIRQKREIEVGVERFLLTTPSKEKTSDRCSSGILEDLAAQIHHTILSVPDSTKRSELWDSLIILGNGSKVKGEE